MNKKYLFFISLMFLVMLVSLASATICQNNKGYYEDCSSGSNSGNQYKTFNVADYDKPIFKGSYGNYRYDMYKNDDYNPNRFFQPRETSRGYNSGGLIFQEGMVDMGAVIEIMDMVD